MKSIVNRLMGLVIAVLVSTTFVSCTKDAKSNKFVGQWQSTSVNFKEYEGDKLVSEETENCISWYMALNLNEGGSGQIILSDDGDIEMAPITWAVMGDQLLITDKEDNEASALTVESISANSMVLVFVEEYTIKGLKHKEVSTYTFKKL